MQLHNCSEVRQHGNVVGAISLRKPSAVYMEDFRVHTYLDPDAARITYPPKVAPGVGSPTSLHHFTVQNLFNHICRNIDHLILDFVLFAPESAFVPEMFDDFAGDCQRVDALRSLQRL